MVDNKISSIIKRNGEIVAFDQNKITVAIHKAAGAMAVHDKAMCERLSDKVVWYVNQNFAADGKIQIPSVEEVQDIVEEVLIKNGHAQIGKAYILYRDYRARQRRGTHGKRQRAEYVPYKKLWQILNWNLDHECETAEKLNRHIRQGSIRDLIQAAEKAYHQDVAEAAQAVLENKDEIRLVIIAGPSSSGKTTTTIKLAEHLRKHGLKLIAMNIDNYFFDLECHPKDEFGDYDFETPEALDLRLIDRHLGDLLQYKTIDMPQYDFKTGKRLPTGKPFQIKKNEIILIDTLHGLYAPMTQSVPDSCKFKLYIETLSQLKDVNGQFTRWTDVRLLRRMTRDRRQRSYDPRMTIEHWHYVRRSELKHIIPYSPSVDYIVNGALCYELAVFKKYLAKYFDEFVERYQQDNAHQDAYIRAKRIHSLFDSLELLENDDQLVPKDSVLREFIGGSSYTYHV